MCVASTPQFNTNIYSELALCLALGMQKFKKYEPCSQVAVSSTEENIHSFSCLSGDAN